MPIETLHIETLSGTTAPDRPRPEDLPDCFPKGRRCDTVGCSTILTIWNPGPYCFCCAAKREAEIVSAAARLSGSARKFTIDQRRQRNENVRTLVADGWLMNEVAALYDISPGLVSKIVADGRHSTAGEQVAA